MENYDNLEKRKTFTEKGQHSKKNVRNVNLPDNVHIK